MSAPAADDPISHAQDMKRYVVPDFTIKDLLDAIPARCFKRSAFRSLLYVFWDLSLLAALTLAHTSLLPLTASLPLPLPALLALKAAQWNAYWLAMGLVATGVWILAHECGHHAFSESRALNNTVGFVLHSALGVPYHSWRISHAQHHASTGHMTRDQVYVPPTRSSLGLPALDAANEDREGRWVRESVRRELGEALGESPAVQMWHVVRMQVRFPPSLIFSLLKLVTNTSGKLFGWQAYVLANAAGQPSYPAGTNHFNPNSVIFDKRHFWQIVQSDIGMLMWLGVLGGWAWTRGWSEVGMFYLPVYLYVNHWLILLTFLQHTDPLLPHYRSPLWTFPRGALTTIDRRFLGPVGAWVLHGITETHVAHHVSSKIPHYGAWEATRALRELLGEGYLESRENMLYSLWRIYGECRFVEDEGDIVFWKNKEGKASCVAVFGAEKGAGGAISDSGVDLKCD